MSFSIVHVPVASPTAKAGVHPKVECTFDQENQVGCHEAVEKLIASSWPRY